MAKTGEANVAGGSRGVGAASAGEPAMASADGAIGLSHASTADPSDWDPDLDAIVAAPKHHKVLFENERLRVLEVTLEPHDEEPVHHHRWRSIFVLDQVSGPIHDISPDGEFLPPNRDVMIALDKWDGQGCLVVHMEPQPAGRVLNASDITIHGIRIEMKI